MNTEQLASAIFDVQPNSLATDELIAISALPDNLLIRSFYANPQSGCDLLSDFRDEQLDDLFFECNSLDDANAKVAQLYAERPLTRSESNPIRDAVLRITLDASYAIAEQRKVDGYPVCMKTIVTSVVHNLRDFIGTFSINGNQI